MATKKQKVAMLKKVALTQKNGGIPPTDAEVMRAAGYSEATIHNPTKLTESDGWKQLLDEYLPDDYLVKGLKEGTQAMKQLATKPVFKKDAPTSQSAHELPASKTGDFIEVPDHAVRYKYYELGTKIKGHLIEKKDITSLGEKLEPIEVVIIEDIPDNE